MSFLRNGARRQKPQKSLTADLLALVRLCHYVSLRRLNRSWALALLRHLSARVWTALPGRVISDPADQK